MLVYEISEAATQSYQIYNKYNIVIVIANYTTTALC